MNLGFEVDLNAAGEIFVARVFESKTNLAQAVGPTATQVPLKENFFHVGDEIAIVSGSNRYFGVVLELYGNQVKVTPAVGFSFSTDAEALRVFKASYDVAEQTLAQRRFTSLAKPSPDQISSFFAKIATQHVEHRNLLIGANGQPVEVIQRRGNDGNLHWVLMTDTELNIQEATLTVDNVKSKGVGRSISADLAIPNSGQYIVKQLALASGAAIIERVWCTRESGAGNFMVDLFNGLPAGVPLDSPTAISLLTAGQLLDFRRAFILESRPFTVDHDVPMKRSGFFVSSSVNLFLRGQLLAEPAALASAVRVRIDYLELFNA